MGQIWKKKWTSRASKTTWSNLRKHVKNINLGVSKHHLAFFLRWAFSSAQRSLTLHTQILKQNGLNVIRKIQRRVQLAYLWLQNQRNITGQETNKISLFIKLQTSEFMLLLLYKLIFVWFWIFLSNLPCNIWNVFS